LENIQTAKIEELEEEIELLRAKYDFSYLIDENNELRESMKDLQSLNENLVTENEVHRVQIEKAKTVSFA